MRTNTPHSLTCWKEIAEYLRKGVRTVQRWERELGLPVHRPVNRSTGILWAIPAELDAWMTTQDPTDGENRETVSLRERLQKLQAENEVLRRALSTLLVRRPLRSGRGGENIPIEFLWEQSFQLLMANVSARTRHYELLERSRQIRSLIPRVSPAETATLDGNKVPEQIN